MPLGRPRRRRRSGHTVLILFLVLAMGGAVTAGLWYGYRALSQDLRDRIAALQAEVLRLEKARDASERAGGALSVELEEARARLRYLETRYERDVPSGAARRLHDLTVQMLDQGVDPDRLAFLIRSAAAPDTCDAEADTKQVMVAVQVPGLALSDSAVTFADRRITVSADGQPDTDAQGRVEAWFDPAAPVQVDFARLGGTMEEVDGPLPLHHSMVLGDSEYRFSIVPGRRGFAEVTAVRCDFP
ncbi:hypothetical protein [Roseospira navarrensis]|uniref:Uncharacterized protein n=1 Tax=Roseospira navarrensis TaxID=140058 RepID=A0A7X1ZAG3_9PROT|nr:hypothetical protein [Roseospira navarrensis]MQX34976.1 hypothetical protein [Roseospira navarrensis]